MTPLRHKANTTAVVERLTELYQRRAGDRIFASTEIPSPALAQFQHDNKAGFCTYVEPEERVRFWDQLLAERRELPDDSLPCAYLSEMDQGLYGGLVGGQVQYMRDLDTGWISSMVPPLCSALEEVSELRVDVEHPHFHRFLHQLKVFVEAGRGRFGVSHFILINGLNFVYELVGATRTYEGLMDAPRQVRHLIDFACELNLAVQQSYFAHAWLLEGGTFSNMAQ